MFKKLLAAIVIILITASPLSASVLNSMLPKDNPKIGVWQQDTICSNTNKNGTSFIAIMNTPKTEKDDQHYFSDLSKATISLASDYGDCYSKYIASKDVEHQAYAYTQL